LTTDASPFDIADWFLGAILAALDDCDREPLSRTYVAAGEIAWDDCCGTLVIAPERVYRVGAFPAEDTTEDLCADRYLAVDLVALIVRCVPTVDDRGRAPTSSALQAAYRNIIEDGAVVMNAVMGPLPDRWERAAVSQTYVGAQGGCVAVETRWTIGNEQTTWTLCCEVPS
jgi:hypothetical protein